MELTYKRIFGTNPKPTTSPLEKTDHLELNASDELDVEGVKKYQSLIGALQWAVFIGIMDITTAVMTISGFRIAPRKEHLECVRRIYGYLSKMQHAVIHVHTEEPDYSDITTPIYDWSYSTHGERVKA